MPWVTPKTNWLAGDGPTNADFNRIEGNSQYVYDVASPLPARVTAIESSINSIYPLAQGIKTYTYTLATSGWSSASSGAYSYYATINVSGLTANDRVDASVNDVAAAGAACIAPYTETAAGYFRLRAVRVPTAQLIVYYTVFKYQ